MARKGPCWQHRPHSIITQYRGTLFESKTAAAHCLDKGLEMGYE